MTLYPTLKWIYEDVQLCATVLSVLQFTFGVKVWAPICSLDLWPLWSGWTCSRNRYRIEDITWPTRLQNKQTNENPLYNHPGEEKYLVVHLSDYFLFVEKPWCLKGFKQPFSLCALHPRHKRGAAPFALLACPHILCVCTSQHSKMSSEDPGMSCRTNILLRTNRLSVLLPSFVFCPLFMKSKSCHDHWAKRGLWIDLSEQRHGMDADELPFDIFQNEDGLIQKKNAGCH